VVDLQLTLTGPVTIGASPEQLAAIQAKLDQIITNQEKTMSELDDLQAAETALDTEVTALETEQATFLADIQAALAAAGTNPAALAAVAADIHAQADKLATLQAAQVAADPATPPAPPTV
jgi:hypothetical protein